VERIPEAGKEAPSSIIAKPFSSAVCLMLEMERKMTFFGTTVNQVARMHHLQKIKVQLKNQ
jgi:hypothetical protein